MREDPLELGCIRAISTKPYGAGCFHWAPAQCSQQREQAGTVASNFRAVLSFCVMWIPYTNENHWLLKKKKPALVCTFLCLGKQEIPHCCSLDLLRSFYLDSAWNRATYYSWSVSKANVWEGLVERTCRGGRAAQGRGWAHGRLRRHPPSSVGHTCLQPRHCMGSSPQFHRVRRAMRRGVLGREFCKQMESKWRHAVCQESAINHWCA